MNYHSGRAVLCLALAHALIDWSTMPASADLELVASDTEDTTRPNLPSGSIAGQIIRLGSPVLVEQALLYLIGLSDTFVTGRFLGEEHLAAVTVTSYLIWVAGALLTIVSVGATALVARLVGAGELREANKILGQAFVLAMIVGMVLLVGGYASAERIVGLLNLSGEAARQAVIFLRIVLAVSPLVACMAAGVACLRGAGDTRTGMSVMILVNALNATFTWALALGVGPFPRLGFAGVAAGTAIAEAVGGVLVLAILVRGRSGLQLRWETMIPRLDALRRILRISLPAAGESLTNIGCQLWFLGLINRLGSTATAAHGVAIRCEALAFLALAAFAVPASTLTGQYLGANRPDLATKAAQTAWAMGVLTIIGFGAILYIAAEPMFSLFLGGNKPGVAAAGIPVLRIVCFAFPALATINVLNGALRGAGDTRWPWAIVVFGYFVIRIPLTYLLATPIVDGGWGLGLVGAWYAMFADLVVRGTLVATRFLQGGWRSAKV